MRKQLNKKPLFLAAAALALTASLSIGSALGYFTTYSTASGSKTLEMGFTETVPHETFDSAGKHVVIENLADSGFDCFVRVKAFATIDLTYTLGDGWRDGGDGYYYYDPILTSGGKTTELVVGFTFPSSENAEDFDVMIVQECSPVFYDDAGNAVPNWDYVITTDDGK